MVFLRFSTGLKWMVGTGQTRRMGSGSTRQQCFLSQPAPSRKSPRMNTPSCHGEGKVERGDVGHLQAGESRTEMGEQELTLGGKRRLLSSTVETVNSQDRVSTDTCRDVYSL